MKVWNFLVGSLKRPFSVTAETYEEAIGACRSAADKHAEKNDIECPVCWDLELVSSHPFYTFKEQRRILKSEFPRLFEGAPWALGTRKA